MPNIHLFCNDRELPNRERYYKYECRIEDGAWYSPWQEIGDNGDVPMDSNMHIGIVAAILLFVCFIGIIFGYLIHRRRKKKRSVQKRQKLLAFNEKETESDNL